MFAVTSEDDLSCPICDSLYTDPRVLPCGHTFCCNCIGQWRVNSRECPLCRGPIGGADPAKNVSLAGLVDSFRQAARSGSECDKCSASSVECRLCLHCRRPFCPACTGKHAEKLRLRLAQRVEQLAPTVAHMEAGIEPLMKAQADWSSVQVALSAALAEANRQTGRLDQALNNRLETVQTAGEHLAELKAAATVTAGRQLDPGRLAKAIESANRLSASLAEASASASSQQQQLQLQAAAIASAEAVDFEEAATLLSQLTACLTPATAPAPAAPAAAAAAAVPPPPPPPDRASLAEYYARFPQRCGRIFSVVGSAVAMAVCWNTAGYCYGRGLIVTTADADAFDDAIHLPLPAEVLVLLEGVPPHTKVKMYSLRGQYKGTVNMRLPDGSPMTCSPSFSLAINSACQLLAVSLPKSNAVLVASLDGAAKQLVTRCAGLDLDNPLGVCISDAARLYIADYRNRRVCCVCCQTGETLRVLEHACLNKVDRLAVTNGRVYARIEPCYLVVMSDEEDDAAQTGLVVISQEIRRKFFHFYVDPFGGLVFTSGGAAESGQLRLIPQPLRDWTAERQLLHWPEVKYSCIAPTRSGRLVAMAANRKEVHVFEA